MKETLFKTLLPFQKVQFASGGLLKTANLALIMESPDCESVLWGHKQPRFLFKSLPNC